MNTKFRIIFLFLSIVSLLSVILCYFFAENLNFENKILITAGTKNAGADAEKLEEINGKPGYTLTYEASAVASAQALNSRHQITLTGTNHFYRDVTRFPMLSGGFFTENAVNGGSKEIVLNKTAAFVIFGGIDVLGVELRINGRDYRIVGVMDDGGDANNVYIPVCHIADRPSSVLVITDSGGEAAYSYAENEFKQIGVTSSNFDFFNLGGLTYKTLENGHIAAGVLALAALALLAVFLFRSVAREFKKMKNLFGHYYFIEFLRKKPRTAAYLAALSAGFCVLTAVFARIVLYIAEILLGRYINYEALIKSTPDCFGGKAQALINAALWSDVSLALLSLSLILFVSALIRAVVRANPRINSNKP